MENKKCLYCENKFTPRTNENAKRFASKLFCSNKCSAVSKHDPIEKRLWESVKIDANGCWNWQKFRCPKGYGRISYNGKGWQAHRVAYVLTHGVELTETDFICHTCDNPPCINPDHLFLGNVKLNAEDMVKKGRNKNLYKAHGSNHVNSIFIESEVIEIRKIGNYLMSKGLRIGQASYRMSKSYLKHYKTIQSILERKSWKHIPEFNAAPPPNPNIKTPEVIA